MRGLSRSLALLMVVFVHTRALETGIDKGTIDCSRERGDATLRAEKGDHGYIVSGGYPGNYSTGGKSGLWCQIHIMVCSTCKVKLQFEELSFAECDTSRREGKGGRQGRKRTSNKDWCHPGCDHMHIHEVDSPYNKVTHRDYFLEDEGKSYVSISGNMRVRHCAGRTAEEDGRRFKIAYQVIDKTELHQGVVSQYGESTGYVTSPNFPHGYALNGETFTYMIQNLDPYGHVRLTFDDWDIAPETQVKVYDGFSENAPSVTLDRFTRPVLVSMSSTLVLVLTAEKDNVDCCYHAGFKAQFQFVSEEEWEERPEASCSEAHPMQGGGIISFTGATASGPAFYDCVWLIKRYNSHNNADAVVLRVEEVLLADGWLRYGKRNSLEIRNGVTSEAPLIARFTARNLTDIPQSFTSQEGLYLRLRGGFYSTDKLQFMYTAVKNVTAGGEGCPGYFDFLCRNLLCIDQELMCDGVDHCGDGSDESTSLDCSISGFWKHSFKWSMPYIEETTLLPSNNNNNNNNPGCVGIVCGRRCISLHQICDGVIDCEGREDEDNCATPVKPKNNSARWRPSQLVVAMVTVAVLILQQQALLRGSTVSR